MNPYITLLRPHQWVKNGFVFLPMFFGGKLADIGCWLQSFIVFVAFSLMASAVYCLNDIRDVETDRAHPVKCRRPLASGQVAVSVAAVLAAMLVITSLGVCVLCGLGWPVTAILAVYMSLNVAYCFKLKSFAIVDVFIVASGFVLRLVAGGVACNIWLSPWIVSLTFLLALFLAFAKRRDDVVQYEANGRVTRKNVTRYSRAFLDQVLGLIGAIIIVCYIMYTVSADVESRLGSRYVYVTSVFVLAGILRYLQLSIVDSRSGSPTSVLYHDRFIQCCVACWISMFMFILYF